MAPNNPQLRNTNTFTMILKIKLPMITEVAAAGDQQAIEFFLSAKEILQETDPKQEYNKAKKKAQEW